MLGLGLGLKLEDFTRVLKTPKDFIVGFVSQLIILPLVAYLFVKIIHLSTLSYQLILSEFSNLWGVGFILIFTVLGLIHMNTGVHEILDDYVHSDVVKKILNVMISIFFLLILIFVCLSLLLIFIG